MIMLALLRCRKVFAFDIFLMRFRVMVRFVACSVSMAVTIEFVFLMVWFVGVCATRRDLVSVGSCMGMWFGLIFVYGMNRV